MLSVSFGNKCKHFRRRNVGLMGWDPVLRVYDEVTAEDMVRVVVDPITGEEWDLCDRSDCDLEIVRPGKVQCRCDDD